MASIMALPLEVVKSPKDEKGHKQHLKGDPLRTADAAVDAPPMSTTDEESGTEESGTERDRVGYSRRGDIKRTSFGTSRTSAPRLGPKENLPLKLYKGPIAEESTRPRASRSQARTAGNKRSPDAAEKETGSLHRRKKAKTSNEAKALKEFGDHLVDDPFERNRSNQKPRVGYGGKDRRRAEAKGALGSRGNYPRLPSPTRAASIDVLQG